MKQILASETCSCQSCDETVLLKSNYLSEFKTNSEKEKARKNLGIKDTIEWGKIIGLITDQQDLVDYIKEKDLDLKEEVEKYTDSQLSSVTNNFDVKLGDLTTNVNNKFVEIQEDYNTKINQLSNKQNELSEDLDNLEDTVDKLATDTKSQITSLSDSLKNKIDKELSGNKATTQIQYINSDYPELKSLQDVLDYLLKSNISFVSTDVKTSCIAENNVATEENPIGYGHAIVSITLTWILSNVASLITVTDNLGNTQSVTQNTVTFNYENLPATKDIVYTLVATGKDTTATTTITVPVYKIIYYGAGEDWDTITDKKSAIVKNTIGQYAIEAGESDYIWVALPNDYDPPHFYINGIEGGFTFVKQFDNEIDPTGTIVTTNLFRTNQTNLGPTLVFLNQDGEGDCSCDLKGLLQKINELNEKIEKLHTVTGEVYYDNEGVLEDVFWLSGSSLEYLTYN